MGESEHLRVAETSTASCATTVCARSSRGIELPDGAATDPPDANTGHGPGKPEERVRPLPRPDERSRRLLEPAESADLFEVRIDGSVVAERHLMGKPAPDTFLAAVRALEVDAAGTAVSQAALAGVAAKALREHDADAIVQDRAELLE